MPRIKLRRKRIYEDVADDDGRRYLVDGIWPRGVAKADARLDAWRKDLAPSAELRRWFGHDPQRWSAFLHRYHAELEHRESLWRPLLDEARRQPVTLLYAARDTEYNNAVGLQRYLERQADEN